MSSELKKEIDICSGSPFFWQYGGRPVLLLGGSVDDNLFQRPNLAEHLDTLAACGGNYVRCTMSSRDPGNVWPFKKAGALYDLDQWNDEYWRRFVTFLEETGRRDVIVQIEVWATFDFYRQWWDENPFNPKNNSTYTAEETGLPEAVATHPVRCENNFFWSVPAANNQQRVLEYQRRYVDKLLSCSLEHGHVLYCMDNETSVTREWGAYWARHIRDAAAKAGKSVHTTEMWDAHDLDHPQHANTFDHPELYTFVDISQNNHQRGQMHYDNALKARARLADAPRPMNCVKTYGGQRGVHGTGEEGVRRFWLNVIQGRAATRFHRPPSGIGLNGLSQHMIRAARDVTDAVDIFRCRPAPELLSGRDENEAYCLAERGRQYLLYFPGQGDVMLDVSDAAGEFELRWYDIAGGGWRPEGEAVKGGGQLNLATPGPGRWAAVLR